MNDYVHVACQWCYRGIWRVLSEWFCVPHQPPTLPSSNPALVQAFKPSVNYLRYLKLFFWIGCVLIDLALAALWLAIAIANPVIGVLITPLMLAVMIVPDIVAYVAIHLKFDTVWYVLSDRSLRIRRGIWVIHETTITFENIQNVRLSQGPIERYFGFANLTVETAGGGSAHAESGGLSTAHHGVMAGIDNAEQLRDQIIFKIQECRSAGLGDERLRDESTAGQPTASHGFSTADIELLAEICDQTALLTTRFRSK